MRHVAALEEQRVRFLNEKEIQTAQQALDGKRVHYLGRENGLLTKVFQDIPTLPKEDRAAAGARANDVKRVIEAEIERELAAIRGEALTASLAESTDLTLP